jgi:signal transduction histidine kinase
MDEIGLTFILSALLLISFCVIFYLWRQLYKIKLDQKDKEAAMLHQARLAQMGEMLSLIAHQWRQPLSEVSGMFMELEAASRFNKLDRALMAKTSARATKLLDYMSDTIDDFRHFLKPSKTKEKFDIEEICQDALTLAKASLRSYGIKASLHVKERCTAIGYPRECAQVILNLILNAKDAFAKQNIKDPWIKIDIKKGKKGVLIEVEDNAKGLDPYVKEHLFEPYISTKPKKHGTGLGLYMSKRIVEESMGGKLWYKDGKHGAIFIVELGL